MNRSEPGTLSLEMLLDCLPVEGLESVSGYADLKLESQASAPKTETLQF